MLKTLNAYFGAREKKFQKVYTFFTLWTRSFGYFLIIHSTLMFMNSPDMLSHENFVSMPFPADGTLTLLVGNMIVLNMSPSVALAGELCIT